MKNFCTHSDGNFLHFGLAMFHSLQKYSGDEDFILHYLCDDLKCFDLLQMYCDKYRITNIVPRWLGNHQIHDKELKNLEHVVPSYEAINVGNRTGKNPKEIQKFWALTPWWSYKILTGTDDGIMYVDADCYFFRNWKPIFDVLDQQNASIGLVRHRIVPTNPINGEFNVGIVYFRDDFTGNAASWSWKNWLLGIDKTYWDTEFSQCGDQGYLMLFPKLFRNICILDDHGILQQAPWNLNFTSPNEDIFYYHFSNFKPDFEGNRYNPGPRHGLSFLDKQRKLWYDEYFEETKEIFFELQDLGQDWMK